MVPPMVGGLYRLWAGASDGAVDWRVCVSLSKVTGFPRREYPKRPGGCCMLLCLVTQSYLTLCDPMDCSLSGSSVHGDSPGKNTGVGFHALLQGILTTQGPNLGLPHCRQILYRLTHQTGVRLSNAQKYTHYAGSHLPNPALSVLIATITTCLVLTVAS